MNEDLRATQVNTALNVISMKDLVSKEVLEAAEKVINEFLGER